VSRLKPSDVRQAQRFTQPVERLSELSDAEQERRLEHAQDGREDAQREAADVEAEQSEHP
jgi:hypothetical protein